MVVASDEGSISRTIINNKHDEFRRVSYAKPPFTLGDIKKAVPPHCFKRSVLRSFSYLIYDSSLAFLFYYVATTHIGLLPKPLSYAAWPIYWFVQGCVFTGIGVIIHECGHHAFSDYPWLDDTIGLVLHSFLLGPYFSWKYSHRRHHSNTNSMEKDELFVPKTKDNLQLYYEYINNPPGRVLVLFITLAFGWPLYLLLHVGGRKYERFACHFDPYGPIYNDRERVQVYISDIGVIVMLYGLFRVATTKGLVWVMCVYGNPLLVANAFLVLITYLQHTHSSLPHYDSSEWSWLRGALATVDRDFGVLNKVFHNLTNTHVVHHLFSSMPHYNAMEATNAIRPILGEYYLFDRTPFYKAIWRETKECVYVEADGVDKNKGVFWFKNKL